MIITSTHKLYPELYEKFGNLIANGSEPLSYRSGIGKPFDFSFVWLKPFIQINSTSVTNYKPMVNAEHRNPEGLDFKVLEEIAFSEGCIIPWSKIICELGLNHYGQVEQGIKSQWNLLKEQYSDLSLGKKIYEFCNKNNILELNDHCINAMEERILFDLISNAGGQEVFYFDYTASEIESVDANQKTLYNQKQMPFISDIQQSFYVASYYDDYFILISGNKKLEEQIRKNPCLEGFFCNEFTDEIWWLEPELKIGELKSFSC